LELPANLLFVIGAIFFILLLLKVLLTFGDVIRELHNPIIASVAPTFTMGTMVISSVLMMHHTAIVLAYTMWSLAVVVQFMLIGFFIVTHIVKATVTLQSVFPSWFVTFVGIGMMPLTAPDFAKPYTIGILYAALAMLVLLLPLVLKRVFVVRDLPIPTKPLITILAAPASLCLTAYLNVVEAPNTMLVTILLVLAQVLYFIVLYELQTLIKMPFYPSFGAFTFPLAVSATALYSAYNAIGNGAQWMEMLIYFETIIATAVVCYVVVVYSKYLLMHMYKKMASQTAK
ncbi:MAG: TDT family transporter, partial [Lysinibacillus sp.]